MRLGRRTEAARKRGRIRKPRLLALTLVLFALSAVAFSYGLVTAIRSELVALDPASWRGDVDTVIYAAPNPKNDQKRVLAILRGDESRVLVSSDQIAPIMKQAIVAVEDKRFFEHNGVDVRGILRAAWEDVRNKAVDRGRLDDHAAVRQERVQPQRPDDRPQGARGGARLAADAALVEGPDPHRLPQHDLLRERRVRDPPGGAHVLPRQSAPRS